MASRPNILILCSDQQRYDTLGCYGNPFVHTPRLDALAAQGVVFERAYCQNPVCTPSRASFMTGRYPRTTCCRQNGQDIPEREITFSKMLADNGYTCGLAGKFHLSACDPVCGTRTERRIDDGFHVFEWSHDPSHRQVANSYQRWLAENNVQYGVKPLDGSQYVEDGMPEEYHHSTFCANMAIDFIKGAARFDDPWLFVVNWFDPHAAFDPPKKYFDRYRPMLDTLPLPNYVDGELDSKPAIQKEEFLQATNSRRFYSGEWKSYPSATMTEQDHRYIKAAYYAMCELLDVQAGRIFDTLAEQNMLDNTIVIYMSDHGELLGDHGMYYKGPFFYEPAIRVPYIIHYPKAFAPGRVSQPVELVGLAPTVLEAAGLQPHPGMQGKSMYSFLQGDGPLPGNGTVYCEYYNSLPWNEPHVQATMVENERYKIVVYHSHGDGELYDLQQDPNETNNVWLDHAYAEVKTCMLQALCDTMAWTVDPLPPRRSPW